MQTITGLKNLYELFQKAIKKNQKYLDPIHEPSRFPANYVIFQYTLSLSDFYIHGDTSYNAMVEFCDLYKLKSTTHTDAQNLYDPEILILANKKLRIPNRTKADGLYMYKK